MAKDYNDFLDEFANDPEKYEQHLEDLMNRIKKELRKSAKDSAKEFFEKFNV